VEGRTHEQTEERRLVYVAVTRARHLLVVSSYCWTATRTTPLGPSPFQQTLRDTLGRWGLEPELWHDKPDKAAANPLAALPSGRAWPMEAHAGEVERRLGAAELVREAMVRVVGDGHHARVRPGTPDGPPSLDAADAGLDVVEAARVNEWDAELVRLLAEARLDRADTASVSLPSSLSATALVRLRDDPDGLAADLGRPMPRRPSPSARFGTRFHAWVEARFGQQELVDPDDLPGRADADIDDEEDLRELIDLFEKGAFGDRTPVAVEPPFAVVLAGQVVRGRIDAVYADSSAGGDGGHADRFLVVDWKTSRTQTADPLQLAVYRVAWAELAGVPVERVRAAFYYIRTGDLVEPAGLDGREELEALLRRESPQQMGKPAPPRRV
jgi:DNA helicase-2/ATP-dependent DNA helicase PcrA